MKIISWIKENKLLVTVLFVGAIFRFYKMDYQSVWLDEIHTLNEANPNLSFSEIYNLIIVTEPHPPLYFLLMKILFTLFGYTTFVLRCFSVVIGIAGIYAIYRLGKELMNKQVGIISALLLSFNYFHLYYSQDGRMYALLFLTTVISFYFLIKFIKNPNYKTAIVSGVFASLMIYTHFFALFVLFAQYLILLFYIVKPYKSTSKQFFIYALISGVTSLVLYLPCLQLFLAAKGRTSIWIPVPGVDAYTQIFKEFFGNSELILFFVIVILFYFFIQLFKRKSEIDFEINPEKDQQIFSFFILFLWIIVTLLIPLILSFVNLPMIISRYFINILPAFLLLIAIGIYYIKNNIVKLSVVSLMVLFSMVDIVVVKKYYKDPRKTQFREATQFIKDNNSSKDEVVTSLAWYLPYFLNNENVKNTIVGKPLDTYVSEMGQDDAKLKSFWYIDGHIRPFNPTETTKAFLEQNFVVDKNIDLYDCYAKHFILKSQFKPNFDMKSFLPLKEINGDSIQYALESFEEDDEKVLLSGWAFLENQNADDSKIYLIALKETTPTVINTEGVKREDVTSYFKNSFNLNNAGFKAIVYKKELEVGTYQFAVVVENSKTAKKGLILTDKKITIK